jgi:hypothetical protein
LRHLLQLKPVHVKLSQRKRKGKKETANRAETGIKNKLE